MTFMVNVLFFNDIADSAMEMPGLLPDGKRGSDTTLGYAMQLTHARCQY